MGIKAKILHVAPIFLKPHYVAGLPPYMWRSNQTTWKVVSVGVSSEGKKLYIVISHEVGPWQFDEQVGGWNKALLAYFKVRYPEYAGVFAGVVATAYEKGTKRSYRTVDDGLQPSAPSLVASGLTSTNSGK